MQESKIRMDVKMRFDMSSIADVGVLQLAHRDIHKLQQYIER